MLTAIAVLYMPWTCIRGFCEYAQTVEEVRLDSSVPESRRTKGRIGLFARAS